MPGPDPSTNTSNAVQNRSMMELKFPTALLIATYLNLANKIESSLSPPSIPSSLSNFFARNTKITRLRLPAKREIAR